jgi:hypothetical protein
MQLCQDPIVERTNWLILAASSWNMVIGYHIGRTATELKKKQNYA